MQIVMDYRPALRARTGVGEYVHELTRHAAAQLGPGDGLTLFSASWRDRLAAGDVPHADTIDRRIPVRLLNLAWHRLAWPPIEALAGRSFDVVHSPHPLLMPARRGAQFVTVHDLDFLDHPERTHGEIRRDYPSLAAPHARRAARIVVPSHTTGRDVEARFGIDKKRIVVCPAGPPVWAAPAPADAPRRHLLFLGTLETRKNIDGLLDAWERVMAALPSGPPLVVAGRATESGATAVARMASAPLAGRVTYAGYVSNEQRQALYREAIALVVPSFYEGFGLTALEAMACGVPVIASTRGSLPEVVGDAGLVVDPADTGALADALLRVLGDDATRARLSAAGIARAATFSWESSARTLVTAYRDAAAEAARG